MSASSTHVELKSEVVLVVIPISEEYDALRICGEACAKSPLRHKQTLVHSGTKQTGLVTGALRLSVAGVRRQEDLGSSVAGR